MPVSLNRNVVQVTKSQSNKTSTSNPETKLATNVESNVVESSLVALGTEGIYLAKRGTASQTNEDVKANKEVLLDSKEDRKSDEVEEAPKAKTPEEFSKMLNGNCYKNNKKDLISIYKSNPNIQEKIESWVNEKKIDSNGQKVPRFNAYDIKILVGIYNSNPNMQDKIESWIKEKTIDTNGNKVPRFGANKIKTLVDLYKSNPDMQSKIESWIEEKTIDQNGNKVPRFDANNIKTLVDLYKSNPDMQGKMEGWIREKTIDPRGNEVHRFNADDIENLVDLYKSNPDMQGKIEGWIEEKTIDSNDNEVPRFAANDIKTLVDLYKSNPDMQGNIEGWIEEKTTDYNGKEIPSFKATDIYKMVNMHKTYPEFIEKVSNNPKLSVLLNTLTWENYHIINDDAILNFVAEIGSNKITSVQVEQLNTENQYKILVKKNKGLEILIVQRNQNDRVDIIAKETIKQDGNTSLVRREFPNGQSLVEEIENVTKDGLLRREIIPISQKKTLYDSNGIQIRSEVFTPSLDKAGEYTINVYERGLNKPMKKKSIGTVKMYGTNSQGSRVERELTSNNGTTTKQTKIYGPKGSYTTYKIVDKDGNILYSQERRQRKIDDNHYTSSLNGQKYDIKFENESITASKLDNDGKVLETITFGPDVIDPQLTELFKGLPGDYLFKIKEMDISKISVDESRNLKDNACYNPINNEILVSKELIQNKFVFAHEFGHALDMKLLNNLNEDADFQKIYKEELAQYKATTSDTEGHSIDYFTQQTIFTRPYCETIAEAHALISGLNNSNSLIQLRGVTLQQHFPKTIAYVAKKLEE